MRASASNYRCTDHDSRPSTAFLSSPLDCGEKGGLGVVVGGNIDPNVPSNIDVLLALECDHASPQSFCVKAVAL